MCNDDIRNYNSKISDLGPLTPVLKDKNGDITSTDMYRSITLTPVISKLFESVLLQLYGDFLTSDNLQFGFN